MKKMIYRHTTMVLLLSLTAVYLLANPLIGNTLTALVGLFVPAGLLTSIFSFGVAPVLALVGAYYLDLYFKKNSFSLGKRIALALLALFITTAVFDLVLYRAWNSAYFFVNEWTGAEIPNNAYRD